MGENVAFLMNSVDNQGKVAKKCILAGASSFMSKPLQVSPGVHRQACRSRYG
jgi:hypothetical protein